MKKFLAGLAAGLAYTVIYDRYIHRNYILLRKKKVFQTVVDEAMMTYRELSCPDCGRVAETMITANYSDDDEHDHTHYCPNCDIEWSCVDLPADIPVL